MPELPEVETITRQLALLLPGKKVSALQALWPASLVGRGQRVDALISQRVTSVTRRGKVTLLNFDAGLSVLAHLRMTGQLLYETSDAYSHSLLTRAVLNFDDGSRLVFNDQRKFGSLTVLPTSEVQSDPLLSKMGPEPLSPDFNAPVLQAALTRHRHQSVKATLLDQTTLAGIGNIYADEVLFTSGIHPKTRSGDLSAPQVKKLTKAIVKVLTKAVAAGGSTMRDYVDAGGQRGTYLNHAQVFGRTNQPCRVCDTSIVKTRVAGRGTHFCPLCQPAPRHTSFE